MVGELERMKLANRTLFPEGARVVLLQHEGLLHHNGKTGISLLRFGDYNIVGVIDNSTAGQSLRELTRIDCDAPVVASMQEALAFHPDILVVGIAPSGGVLPEPWLREVEVAVSAGLSVVSGLHSLLGKMPQFQSLPKPGQKIWDVRQEPAGLGVGTGAARLLPCSRVLTVGTDMAVGKMSTSIALHQLAIARGMRSSFVASGQTGLMLTEHGIPLDAIRVDFAAGSVQQVVLSAGQDADIVFVEGQGSLCNPASTATLPLMRGTQPTHQILVHRAGSTHISTFTHVKIPPLSSVVALCEATAAGGGAFAPAPVVGIALNTWHMSDEEARSAVAETTDETGLPCTDPIRFGAEPLLDAIQATPASPAL